MTAFLALVFLVCAVFGWPWGVLVALLIITIG